MAKRWYKISALLFSLLFLFGCATAPSSPGASSVAPSSGTAPAGGTDEGVRTAKDVEEIPEMAEIHFATAVDAQISEDFAFLQTIRERGLQHPYIIQRFYHPFYDSYMPYSTFRYVTQMNLILSQQDVSKRYWGDRDKVLQKMINDIFADENIRRAGPNLFAWYFSNSDPQDNYDFTGHASATHSDSQFHLYWEDEGNIRRVVLTEYFHYSYEPDGSTHIFEYEKGTDGIYRLLGGRVTRPKPDTPVVENATHLPDRQLASQIIGSIGQTVVALDDWDHTVTLTGLGWNDFAQKAQVVIPGKLFNYRIRDEKLYLLFDDKVLVMDDQLSIVEQQALPEELLQIIRRPPSQEYMYYDGHFFWGYDVTKDLATYAYACEKGMFLVDAATGESRQIYTPKPLDRPPMPPIITPSTPCFTADDTQVYGILNGYELSEGYVCYTRATGRTTVTDPGLILNSLSPALGGMYSYFYPTYFYDYSGVPYTGQNHYVAITYKEGTGREYWIGRLDDTTYLQNQLHYPLGWMKHVITLFSDGRVVFEYEGHFFCTPPYDELFP